MIIYKVTKTQLKNLQENGSITVNGTVYNYDSSSIYLPIDGESTYSIETDGNQIKLFKDGVATSTAEITDSPHATHADTAYQIKDSNSKNFLTYQNILDRIASAGGTTTANDGKLTINVGTTAYSFTANQSTNQTISLAKIAGSGSYTDLTNKPDVILLNGGTRITSGDLNDFKTIGNYYCNADTYAKALSNIPVTNLHAFKMVIYSATGDGSYITQKITEYDSQKTWVRTYNGSSTWWSWKLIEDNMSNYLPLSGGTLTGHLNGRYLCGTWLQTTAATNLNTTATKIPVLDGSGWLYYRTNTQLANDLLTAWNLELDDSRIMGSNGSLTLQAEQILLHNATLLEYLANDNREDIDLIGVDHHGEICLYNGSVGGMTADILWSGSSEGGMGMAPVTLTLSTNPSNYVFLMILARDSDANYHTFVMKYNNPYEVLARRTISDPSVEICFRVKIDGTSFIWEAGQAACDMEIYRIYGVK